MDLSNPTAVSTPETEVVQQLSGNGSGDGLPPIDGLIAVSGDPGESSQPQWVNRLDLAILMDIPLSEAKRTTDELAAEYPQFFRTNNDYGKPLLECDFNNLAEFIAERMPPEEIHENARHIAAETGVSIGRIERMIRKLQEGGEFEGEFTRRMGELDDVPRTYFKRGPVGERLRAIFKKPDIGESESSESLPKAETEEEQELLDDFAEYSEEMKAGVTMDAQELEDLLQLFGPENATDLVFHLNPRFERVPVGYVNSFIKDYLGDFVVVKGELNLDRLEKAGAWLSTASFKDALTEVIKADCLANYHRELRDDEGVDEVVNILQYLEDMRDKIETFENDELTEVIKVVEEYYKSVFQDTNPTERFVDRLRKDRPFPDLNQRVNIKAIMDNKTMLIADDPGFGKSLSAIIAKERLSEELGYGPAVVVLPASILEKKVWQEYLSAKVGDDGEQIGYFRSDMKPPRILEVDGMASLEGVKKGDYDYIFLTHGRLTEEYVNKLKSIGFDMLIIDEAHKLKNLHEGQQAQQLVRMADYMSNKKLSRTVMLTGTPIPNLPSDIGMSLRILYPKRFAGKDPRSLAYQMIDGEVQDLDVRELDVRDIRSLLLPRMQRKRLEDCVKIPPIMEITESIELSEAEKELYEFHIADDEIDFTSKITGARQILTSPDILRVDPPIMPAKAKRLNQILNSDEGFKSQDKIILFVHDYVDSVIKGDRTLFDHLRIPKNVKILKMWGDVSAEERYRIQKEFQESDEKIFLVVNGQVADVGINLSAADQQIHWNPGWRRSDEIQEIGRSQRPGRTKPLVVRRFLAANTIEVGIREYALAKERANDKLLVGIPLTDAEKQVLRTAEEKGKEAALEVNSDLGKHYFSAEQRLNRMHANTKQQGESAFGKLVRKYGSEYADTYTDFVRRSYQANMSRLSGAVIEEFLEESETTVGKHPLILDLASGPEMLKRNIADKYVGKVLSLDMNPNHFYDGSGEKKRAIGGSIVKLPLRPKVADVVNMGLVLDVTKFLPTKAATDKEALERLEIFKEVNRVLKPGGRAVITQLYSLDLVDPKLFEQLVARMGFKVVGEKSGQVFANSELRGRLITLEKLADSPTEMPALVHQIGDAIQGLKFQKTEHSSVRNPKMMDRAWRIKNKGTIVPTFNTENKRVADEEEAILKLMQDSVNTHGGEIASIPAEDIVRHGLTRVYHNKGYVLFKRLGSAAGAVFMKKQR